MHHPISTQPRSLSLKGIAEGRSKWLAALLCVAALLVVTKYVLLDTAAEPGPTFSIDVEALHRAATAQGALPERIEVERVAEFAFPRSLVIAGAGLTKHPMSLNAYRVVWADRSLVIDAAMSAEAATRLPLVRFDTTAYDRVQKALTQAHDIIFTHEHADHVGGVAAAPAFAALANKVRMTREQLLGLERESFAPGALLQLQPLDYSGLVTIAPGIVLQKAPGHSAGAQLIYVELARGARYLFVGDIAWSEDNIKLQKGRPRLAELLFQEDRTAVAAEVQAIAALPKDVHVVVAHDPVALLRDIATGLLQQGFTD